MGDLFWGVEVRRVQLSQSGEVSSLRARWRAVGQSGGHSPRLSAMAMAAVDFHCARATPVRCDGPWRLSGGAARGEKKGKKKKKKKRKENVRSCCSPADSPPVQFRSHSTFNAGH